MLASRRAATASDSAVVVGAEVATRPTSVGEARWAWGERESSSLIHSKADLDLVMLRGWSLAVEGRRARFARPSTRRARASDELRSRPRSRRGRSAVSPQRAPTRSVPHKGVSVRSLARGRSAAQDDLHVTSLQPSGSVVDRRRASRTLADGRGRVGTSNRRLDSHHLCLPAWARPCAVRAVLSSPDVDDVKPQIDAPKRFEVKKVRPLALRLSLTLAVERRRAVVVGHPGRQVRARSGRAR